MPYFDPCGCRLDCTSSHALRSRRAWVGRTARKAARGPQPQLCRCARVYTWAQFAPVPKLGTGCSLSPYRAAFIFSQRPRAGRAHGRGHPWRGSARSSDGEWCPPQSAVGVLPPSTEAPSCALRPAVGLAAELTTCSTIVSERAARAAAQRPRCSVRWRIRLSLRCARHSGTSQRRPRRAQPQARSLKRGYAATAGSSRRKETRPESARSAGALVGFW